MTAIVQDEYGPAPEDVLWVEPIDKPAIGEDDVLVRVHAASVDRGTWHAMAGLPYPIRLAGFGLRRPKYRNPGRNLAGTVEAVGTSVTGFKPGDAVFGIGDASFAVYARARPDKLAPKPANLSLDQAAAVPISALAALQAVRDHGQVQAAQKVLIVGASGGVGTFAVQIAKTFGAEVTGVCSTAKVDAVRALGADHVVDYTREDFADGRHRYDVILDIGGNRRLSHLRRTLTPRGRLVIVGGETDGRWLGGIDRQLRALLLSPFVGQKLGAFVASENAEDLMALESSSTRASSHLPSSGPIRSARSPRRSATCSTGTQGARSSSPSNRWGSMAARRQSMTTCARSARCSRRRGSSAHGLSARGDRVRSRSGSPGPRSRSARSDAAAAGVVGCLATRARVPAR